MYVAVDKCYGRIEVGLIARNFKGEVVAARCFTENILVKPIVGVWVKLWQLYIYAVEFG
jgi:hypothetical protein